MYERLVEALRNMDVSDACPCSVGNMCDDQDCIVYQAADAIEELSNSGSIYGKAWTLGYDAGRDENMPRWIPVTERLPDKFQSIFAACKSEGRENWTIDTVYDPFLKCPWGPIPILESGKAVVYAWMDNSTPEPPKEET